MYEFKLPDLGEGIHEGEILKWHVNVGEMIKEDDPLVEVETDKAAVAIPSPKGGKLVSVAGKVGDVIIVGDVIAVIASEGEEISVAAPVPKEPSAKEAEPPEKEAPLEKPTP